MCIVLVPPYDFTFLEKLCKPPEATRMESFIRENMVGFASRDRSMIPAVSRNNCLDRNKARLMQIMENREGFISIVLFHP